MRSRSSSWITRGSARNAAARVVGRCDAAVRACCASVRADAFRAIEARRPFGTIAVHVLQQLAVVVAAQLGLHFARVLLRQLRGPFRREAGVHHHPAQRTVDVREFLRAQPVEQFARVLGEQHALQVGIDLALLVRRAFADRQQREIVVAEHDMRHIAQRMHQAQGFDRLAAAVDQVAAEPQAVAGRIEAQLLQQALGDVVATLQVADGPGRHGPVLSAACAARTG